MWRHLTTRHEHDLAWQRGDWRILIAVMAKKIMILLSPPAVIHNPSKQNILCSRAVSTSCPGQVRVPRKRSPPGWWCSCLTITTVFRVDATRSAAVHVLCSAIPSRLPKEEADPGPSATRTIPCHPPDDHASSEESQHLMATSNPLPPRYRLMKCARW